MQKILILKTGAAGDVVRTTTLLRILKGAVTWVIEDRNRFIFPDDLSAFRCVTLESAIENLRNEEFDLVLSLEENNDCAELASAIKTKKLIGVFLQDGKLKYTDDSRGWFDMSLCSLRGPNEANRLKKANAFSYQHWLFRMLNKEFGNEPYAVYSNSAIRQVPGLIGLEKRTGDVWPNKNWLGYEELADRLKAEGFQIRYFEHRSNVREYMDDIASCSCIISGDTLAMHLAIAYHIPGIAIFNCTSPAEIYSYGVLKKIVSPLLEENFYSRTYSREVAESVSVSEVFAAVKRLHLQK